MMKFKLLIFDVDGTIADTDKVILKTYIELYKLYSSKEAINKKKILTFSGPPLKETLAKEFPNLELEFITSEYKRISKGNYYKYLKTFRNCKKVLLKLKKEGYLLALATSKYKEATNFTLNLLQFTNIFDFIVAGDEVQNPKPAPDCVLNLLKKTNCDKEETLFIGDTVYDVQCGKQAGVKVAIMEFKKRNLNSSFQPDIKLKNFNKLYNYIKNYGN